MSWARMSIKEGNGNGREVPMCSFASLGGMGLGTAARKIYCRFNSEPAYSELSCWDGDS